MSQPLFASRSIEDVRRALREKVLRDLAEIDEAGVLDDPSTTRELRKSGLLELPELVRPEAKFETFERGENLHVTVSIPVTGGWSLLEVKPQTFTTVRPSGYIERSTIYTSDGRALLRMTESFPRTAKADSIKAWAAREADHVQEYIEFLRPDISMHNDDVEKLVTEGLERRRRELDDLGGLRGDLEGGI